MDQILIILMQQYFRSLTKKEKKNCEGLPVTARLKCFKSFLGYICSVKVPERRLYSGGAWSLLPDKKQKDEWKWPQVAPEKV